MGFLKNIFKRKVGGTFFGNLLRSVAHTATGGLLGNGAMMLHAGDVQNDQAQKIMASNQKLQNALKQMQVSSVQGGVIANKNHGKPQIGIMDKMKMFYIQHKEYVLAAAGVVVAAAAYYFIKKNRL